MRVLRGRAAFYAVVAAFCLQAVMTAELRWQPSAMSQRIVYASALMVAFVATLTLGSFIRSGRASDNWRTLLKRVIAAEAVDIYFQPIVHSHTGELIGYEALARPRAGCGFSSADELYRVSEVCGLACELDVVAHRHILAAAQRFGPDTALFVNFSLQSLAPGERVIDQFAQAVRTAGLAEESIVVELTERSELDTDSLKGAAKKLRAHGFRIALDDTGAGNSGLNILSQLPVDFIKIDRAVLERAIDEPSARGVIAGIIAIARETGSLTIAEGIEDQAMFEVATMFRGGTFALQGYLLGRPRTSTLERAELREVEAKVRAFVRSNRQKIAEIA